MLKYIIISVGGGETSKGHVYRTITTPSSSKALAYLHMHASHIHTHWRHFSQHLFILFFWGRCQSSCPSENAQASCPPCRPLIGPQPIRFAQAPLRVPWGQAERWFCRHPDSQAAFQSVAFVWCFSTWLGRLQEEGVDETWRSWPGWPIDRYSGRAIRGARGGLRTPEL